MKHTDAAQERQPTNGTLMNQPVRACLAVLLIYEVLNNGGWYNFGFMVGVSAFFSGGPPAAMRSGSRKAWRGSERARGND
jgi:hypothetical protein